MVKKTALQSVRNLVIHSLYTSYGDVATHSALKLKKKTLPFWICFLVLPCTLLLEKKSFRWTLFGTAFFEKLSKILILSISGLFGTTQFEKLFKNVDFSHWGKQRLLSHYIAFFWKLILWNFCTFFVDFKNHCAAMDDLQSMYSIGWYDVEADFGRLVAIQPLQNVEGTLQIFG